MKASNAKSERKLLLVIICVILILSIIFCSVLIPILVPRGVPQAVFTYWPSEPIVNETVIFNASDSYDPDGWILSYKWDFGDGAVLVETDPITYHGYSAFGAYEVKLTVRDNDNLTDFSTKIVTVREPPIAYFTYSPLISHVDDEIFFDASASRAQGGYITLYRWDFGDGTIRNVTNPVTTHVFTKVGTYNVSLTVTDSERLQDTTVKLINIVTGAIIDVYTQHPYPYGGQGLNRPSDAFAPQMKVVLYAEVTYDKRPLRNELVIFEIHAPPETLIIRTATTDAYGIAMVSLRIPWQVENVTTIFGTWLVYASVEAVEQKVNDTLTFPVGWLVELFKVETCDHVGDVKTRFAAGEYVYFKVYVRNIALVRKNLTITLAVHDELNVPIGQVVLGDLVIPPQTTMIMFLGMQIPKWAFVGKATVYANALTDLPTESGVPYCPEKSADFTIVGERS